MLRYSARPLTKRSTYPDFPVVCPQAANFDGEMFAERYTELDSRLVSSRETVLHEGIFNRRIISSFVIRPSRFL